MLRKVTIVFYLCFTSCEESKVIGPETVGYDYYPIKFGQYRIYDVQEIKYGIIKFDTVNYQLKETIFDSIHSNDQVTYLIRRDKRVDEAKEWVVDSLWTLFKSTTFLAITENNIPLMKLTFPVKAGRSWDGNRLNNRDTLNYYYQSLSSSVIDTIEASDHIQVIIKNDPQTSKGIDRRSEVYVRGIGLVSKDYLTQINCTSTSCGANLGKVQRGRSLSQVLIEAGVEI